MKTFNVQYFCEKYQKQDICQDLVIYLNLKSLQVTFAAFMLCYATRQSDFSVPLYEPSEADSGQIKIPRIDPACLGDVPAPTQL